MHVEPIHSSARRRSTGGPRNRFNVAAACTRWVGGCLSALTRYPIGRIVLHLLAMAGDRCVRFHLAGIVRELPPVAALTLFLRARHSLLEALIRYLVRPLADAAPTTAVDPQSLAAVLNRGDVLLTVGNSRFAALVQRVTRSPWSHVSLYVGPLEDGPDPRCIVEADITAGVRSIRLSELNALHVRLLRPIGLGDTDRYRLATWVIDRIGCKYDLAHAWEIGQRLLPLPMRRRSRSEPAPPAHGARSFICCSLLAHAFALVGSPISTHAMSGSVADSSTDQRNLTPGDFERAPVFEVIDPPHEPAHSNEGIGRHHRAMAWARHA